MKDKRIGIEGDDIWLLKELGVYSDDPKEDQMNNDRLREYLKSIGYKMAKIELDLSKDQTIPKDNINKNIERNLWQE